MRHSPSAFALAFLACASINAQPRDPYNWTAVGPMGTARADACAVLLQDGRALVIGGIGSDGSALASAELFNTDQTFSPAPSLNTARASQSCSVLADGRVLVAGGTDGQGKAIASFEIFDPVANAWSMSGNLNQARWDQQTIVLNDGRVLVAGGCNAPGSILNTLELFDPVMNQFNMAATTLSSPRKSFAAALLQSGQVLFAGGSDGMNSLASTDIFDPATSTVSPGPMMMLPRAALTASALLDGTVLIVGGNDGAQDLATAELYDPLTTSFSYVFSELGMARSGHLAFVIPSNGNVLIVGGSSNGAALAVSELYTFHGEFSTAGSTSTPRAHATGVALGPGTAFVAGGRNESGVEARCGTNSGPCVNFTGAYETVANNASAVGITVNGGYAAGGGLPCPGFQSGEFVNLLLQTQNNSGSEQQTLAPATADSTGSFSLLASISGATSALWTITATGQTSGLQASWSNPLLLPAISLSFSCNPCSALEVVTMTAIVKNAFSYSGSSSLSTYTGSGAPMTFYDGTNRLGAVAMAGPMDGSSATGIYSGTLAGGTHAISAAFNGMYGPNGFNTCLNCEFASGIATASLTVNKLTTAVNASVASAVRAGALVTVQAQVSPLGSGTNSGAPTGSVFFFDGSTPLGQGASVVFGSAALTTTFAAGAHSITANYSGDPNFLAGTSAPVTVMATNGITPTVSAAASPNPVPVGQEVSIGGFVSHPAGSPKPAGGITFKLASSSGSSTETLPISVDVSATSVGAVLKIRPSQKGKYSVTATYNGDANYNPASSAAFILTVN